MGRGVGLKGQEGNGKRGLKCIMYRNKLPMMNGIGMSEKYVLMKSFKKE